MDRKRDSDSKRYKHNMTVGSAFGTSTGRLLARRQHPPNLALTKLSRGHDKVTTAFIAACRDFCKHSRFVEALGRDVLAVPPGTDQK